MANIQRNVMAILAMVWVIICAIATAGFSVWLFTTNPYAAIMFFMGSLGLVALTVLMGKNQRW